MKATQALVLFPSLIRRALTLNDTIILYAALVLTLHSDATLSITASASRAERAYRTSHWWFWDLCSLLLRWGAVSAKLRGGGGEDGWETKTWGISLGSAPVPSRSCSAQDEDLKVVIPEYAVLQVEMEGEEEKVDDKENYPPSVYESPLPVYHERPLEQFQLQEVEYLESESEQSDGEEEQEEQEEEYRPSCRPRVRQRYSTALAQRAEQLQPLKLSTREISSLQTQHHYDAFINQQDAGPSDVNDFQDVTNISSFPLSGPVYTYHEHDENTRRDRYYGDFLHPTCIPRAFHVDQYHHYHSQRRKAHAPLPRPTLSIHLDASTSTSGAKAPAPVPAPAADANDPGAHPSNLSWCFEDEADDLGLGLQLEGWYRTSIQALEQAKLEVPVPMLMPRPVLIIPMLMVEGWPAAVWWPNEMRMTSDHELHVEFAARAGCFMQSPEDFETITHY